MDLYDVMRTTFAAREFTDDPVSDEVLGRIFENARFAPSGGNRQGGHVLVIREQATKDGLSELAKTAAQRYAAQVAAGENPWNTFTPTSVSGETIASTRIPPGLTEPVRRAPVVLVVCVDLRVVASVDQLLDRVGIASGASIYPLAWNILLAARNEGLGGVLTTMPIAEEPKVRQLLGLPEYMAVCAVMPIGKPVRQLRKLKRKPVAEFVVRERWGGEPFSG
ncbi:MAG: nitroreductase family protein [Dehalococcoidia bacterium]